MPMRFSPNLAHDLCTELRRAIGGVGGKGWGRARSLRVRASRQKTIWTAASDFLDAVDGRATQCNEMNVAVLAVFAAAAAVIHDSYLWSVSLSLSLRLVSNLLREIYTSPFSAV